MLRSLLIPVGLLGLILFSLPSLAANSAAAPGVTAPESITPQLLDLESSFVTVGGGTSEFSILQLFTNVQGADYTKYEIARLKWIYGAPKTEQWIDIFNFSISDSYALCTAAGMPFAPPSLTAQTLGPALVTFGQVGTKKFYPRVLLEDLLSPKLEGQVLDDIRTKFGPDAEHAYLEVSFKALNDLFLAVNSTPPITPPAIATPSMPSASSGGRSTPPSTN